MKFELKGNKVTATAETVAESAFLLSLADKPMQEKRPAPVVEKKTRKKHTFTKECPICGAGFRGLGGVGLHLLKKHGIGPEHNGPMRKSAYQVALEKVEEEKEMRKAGGWQPLSALGKRETVA